LGTLRKDSGVDRDVEFMLDDLLQLPLQAGAFIKLSSADRNGSVMLFLSS